MQKNVPKYTPEWVRDGDVVGGGVEARRLVRAVQRPAHAAVVREPARDRVPPDARARRRARPHSTHLVLDLDPPEADAFAMAVAGRARWCARRSPTPGSHGAVKTSGAKGVHVFVPIDGQASHRGRGRGATRAIAARAERLDPDDRHDRVHQGGPRRQGVRRLRPASAARPWSRPTARASGRACRSRSRSPGTTSTTSRPRDFTVHTAPERLGDRDPWAEHMPAPQHLPRRPRRGGPRDPDRPRAGDARGQAPRTRCAAVNDAGVANARVRPSDRGVEARRRADPGTGTGGGARQGGRHPVELNDLERITGGNMMVRPSCRTAPGWK